MSKHITRRSALPVEEAWIADWVAEGVAALERYLARQAAFADYLRERESDLHSDDGDARTSA